MAKAGGSRERESKSSRKRSILSEKKSENRSGRSERGMSDGRGAVLDLPNSSLDTAKSSLLEELWCRSSHGRTVSWPSEHTPSQHPASRFLA